VELVDNYVATREQGANQDMEQRQSVIADAFRALQDTGTGRNYFGKERKANSPEYDEMMRGIIDYGRQLGPRAHISGFENHILTQKCLAYISDKMKVRSTTTGQIRFNNTMRILGQVMPEDEFSALCNRINRVRGVANKPEHDNYVSRETYVPAPIPRVVNHPQAQQNGKPGMTTPAGPTPK
jgi:hypothetical protein